MQDNVPLTIGIDHVGFAVKDLAHARRFFRECLGWRVVGENESHPASFVSDGNGIVTLWQVEDPDIGLHHLALKVVAAARLKHCTSMLPHGPAPWWSLRQNDRARAQRYTLWCENLTAPGLSLPAFLLPPENGGPVPLAPLRSADAPPVFASLGIIHRGTIRFILTGAMTSFCRLLK